MLFSRLSAGLRLAILLQASRAPMSLSGSSGQKVMQSPFSHADLYGVQHPLSCSNGSKASTAPPSTAPVARKSKSSKRKKPTVKVANSSNPKPKNKKKKSTKMSSAPTLLSTRNHTHKSPPAATFSLAQVDAGSPCASRKPPRPRAGHVTHGSAPPISSSVQVDIGSPVGRSLGTHSKHQDRSTLANTGTKDQIGGSKVLLDSKVKKNAVFSAPTSSLLTFSTMSTTDVVLRMRGCSQQPPNALAPPMGPSTADVRMKSKRIPSLHLPPHMRVNRQVFQTSSRQLGTFGLKKPLTVEEIAKGLGRAQYQRVIVMSGAGVSTSSGIPDFRTPGTGLYDNLQHYNIPDPTAIFDISYFSRQPKPFYALARSLYPGQYQPNAAHHFVRLLQDKNVLLRNYTQNIDGLERIAGVQSGKLVEAHGSFSSASCIQCGTKHNANDVKADILTQKIPRCKHKYCYGLVKPDIVFFGEDLPPRFYSLQLPDFSKCDLLIIMGTSLEVEPFASLAALPCGSVPRLLLNRELVGPFRNRGRGRLTDVAVTGDIVESVMSLAKEAGWEQELRQLCGQAEEEEVEGEEGGEEVDAVGQEGSSGMRKNGEGGRFVEAQESTPREGWPETVFATEPQLSMDNDEEKENTSYPSKTQHMGGVVNTQPPATSSAEEEELMIPLSGLTLEEKD